jgi:hypothetical protein
VLFSSTKTYKNQPIDEATYQLLGFDQQVGQISYYKTTDSSMPISALQMSPNADSFWSVTEPNKQLLLKALENVILGVEGTTVKGRFAYNLSRTISDEVSIAIGAQPVNLTKEGNLDNLV